MLTGIVLVVIAVLFRFASPVFGTWNFVPMGAVALYAGARLPSRWAWLVPLSAMVISDLVLDYGGGRSVNELWRWVNYGTFTATTLLGPLARGRNVGVWRYPALSLAASTLFFLTSNFAVWAEGQDLPDDRRRSVHVLLTWDSPSSAEPSCADLAGTAVLFGLGPVVESAVKRLTLAASRRIDGRDRSLAVVARRLSFARIAITPTPREPLELARLLVSVRSPVEARAAVAGGADIIDVKEPSRGSLGRADASVWQAVRAVVPRSTPVSVALGELNEWLAPEPRQIPESAWAGIDYCKLGLAGAPADWVECWAQVRRDLRNRATVVS